MRYKPSLRRLMMTPLEARLTEKVAVLRRENQQLQEDHRQLREENKLLREKIDLLVKRIFGTKSEQLNEQQLMLLLQGGDEEAKKLPPPARIPPSWRLNRKSRPPLTAVQRIVDRAGRACRSIFQRWRPSSILTRSKPIPPPGAAWVRK